MSDINKDKAQNLRLELFEKTGLKFDEDDPIIQLYLVQECLLKQSLIDYQKDLNNLGETLITEIKSQQEDILSSFDGKRDDLLNILSKLDNHKEAMVADVWLKLQQKLQTQIHEDMQAIANNANNKINNQRNMLTGGVIGLLIGLLVSIILFILK